MSMGEKSVGEKFLGEKCMDEKVHGQRKVYGGKNLRVKIILLKSLWVENLGVK